MKRYLTTLMMTILSMLSIWAQDVMVTVAPVQQVLPPQALMYVSNPGKYFNVSITNVSASTQYVYLSLQIDRIFPSSQNILATPHKKQPSQPIIVPSNGTIQLTMAELKRNFSHFSPSEVRTSGDLFDGYGSGAFGLMPEGQYQVRVTAYKWSSPQYASPVVVSNPSGGNAYFHVAYKANAPEFLTPIVSGFRKNTMADIDPMNAQFTWKEPVIASAARYARWIYSFKVVEVLEGQPVDYAMDNNPIVYQVNNLSAPLCIIPPNYVKNRLAEGRKYAACVTASPKNLHSIDYVLVENSGRSDICQFQIHAKPQMLEEPLDTLADKEMIASTEELFEDVEEVEAGVSFDEYAAKVSECAIAASDADYEAQLYDSIAVVNYSKLRSSVYVISRTTFAAAKKEGYTQKAKDAFSAIENAALSARMVSENSSALYVQAYRSLKAMGKVRRSMDAHEYDSNDVKAKYQKAVDDVQAAKQSAQNAKVHYESAKRTLALAKTRYKYLSK